MNSLILRLRPGYLALPLAASLIAGCGSNQATTVAHSATPDNGPAPKTEKSKKAAEYERDHNINKYRH